MNELVLTVAPDEFGRGVCEGLEPVIDGVSLVDVLKWSDGEIRHGGVTGFEAVLEGLSVVPVEGEPTAVQVLGCLCGVDGCTGVAVTISATDGAVSWSDVRWCRVRDASVYENVGPFVFARAQYLSAVLNPVRAERPVREQADLDALAAGMPRDHVAWLRSMTMAFRSDFLSPWEPGLPRSIAIRALRAFARSGDPLPESAIRKWAADRNASERAIDEYVKDFRDVAALAQDEQVDLDALAAWTPPEWVPRDRPYEVRIERAVFDGFTSDARERIRAVWDVDDGDALADTVRVRNVYASNGGYALFRVTRRVPDPTDQRAVGSVASQLRRSGGFVVANERDSPDGPPLDVDKATGDRLTARLATEPLPNGVAAVVIEELSEGGRDGIGWRVAAMDETDGVVVVRVEISSTAGIDLVQVARFVERLAGDLDRDGRLATLQAMSPLIIEPDDLPGRRDRS